MTLKFRKVNRRAPCSFVGFEPTIARFRRRQRLARLELNHCSESKSDASDLVLKTHHAASIPVYLGPMLYIVLEILSLEKLETKMCKFGKNVHKK
jgi:hypothetical protein